MNSIDLNTLGFTAHFAEAAADFAQQGFQPARVTSVNRSNLDLICEAGHIRAEPTGRLLFAAEDSQALPTVGDWVGVQLLNDDTFGLIHTVLPRKSLLRRKDPGRNIEYQLLGANIDVAFLVQAADRDFNLNRLERYLVMVRDGGIRPIVVLGKADLVDTEERIAMLKALRETAGDVSCLALSSVSGEGVHEIRGLLTPGITACMLGSSGVGKTTLLNILLEREAFPTSEVREIDHRGRHTTTRRQLTILENGAMLIDTPGLRELGNFGAESGMDQTFSDIMDLARECRFSDCRHDQEKGCAVVAAIEEGRIDEEHFENWRKLQREAAHYERSYLERRQRDKEFGKMVKRVMKGKR
jgi:ribosome biogenesis GTPase